MEALVRREGTRGARWRLDHLGRPAPEAAERSDAARNRRRIVEAARRLFAERGACAVSMEEIAREAGIGKGTLYRRFPHKGVLCEALLDEPTRQLQEETMRDLADPGSGPLEKLDRFLSRLARFTEENLDLLYGGHEPLSGEARVAYYSHPAHQWRRWTVLGLLRAAVREGALGEELDVEYLSEALLAPLGVDLYYHQRRVQGMSAERIAAGLRSLVPGRGGGLAERERRV
ncbi:transcriptional regulator, TetR family [Rubrobacter xylanophilus DSM 9941]|uniref:Transcriptional regulator, TetR family n=1 Tax=Rubrobacter xylanophilus (strain DSM 9941 / JCM 11954 / NBRC 16129 / PRD-1) TaxID=266117 RepID=Q1AX63_RUBXD|nr:transcriptional regulator, TetR family [Rubrobacter xylanophilus DSM 9941]